MGSNFKDPERHREYYREYMREYRKRKGRKPQTAQMARKRQERLALVAVLKQGGCEKCGFKGHPAALDFHHVGAKDFNISRALGSWSWKRVLEEIAKCVVWCANCHRTHHFGTSET